MKTPPILPQEQDRTWNIVVFVIQLLCFLPLFYYTRYDHLPAPGWSIAFLAVAAALISVHDKITNVQRALWMVLIAFLLAIELRAIAKDRWDTDQKQGAERREEQGRFQQALEKEDADNRAVLKTERDNLESLLTEQHTELDTTLGVFSRGQAIERRSFAGVVAKEQELFDHEEKLAKALNGNLLPANEPTPKTGCGETPQGAALLILGDERQGIGAVVTTFPHTIVESVVLGKKIPSISLDRDSAGTLVVLMDIRSADGRIIARLNREGFVVNRNNYLELKSDTSSLHIEDEYGDEVLDVRYLNRSTIRVRGKGVGLPQMFRNICSSAGPGNVDYVLENVHP